MGGVGVVIESWMPIPGYEGYYEVSNQGAVRSIDRQVINSLGCTINYQGKTLKQATGDFHPKVLLYKNGKRKNCSVHSLVLLSFVGECPVGHECCHGNGNARDNQLSNLRWGTRKDNDNDKKVHGTTLRGEKNPKAKLTYQNVQAIRLMKGKASSKPVAESYSVSRSTICRIWSGQAWSTAVQA